MKRYEVYEVKVPTPLKATYHAGIGSRDGGGAPASVGHTYGFGSTEEEYRLLILGTSERGRRSDGPLVHATNTGWVKKKRGHYYDALFVKKNKVVPFIVEAMGGITPHAMAHLRYLARRATGAGAHDRTRYGTARSSTKSFEAHHTQRISKAAVIYDAMAIRKQTTSLKQRVFGCAAQAAAGEGEA